MVELEVDCMTLPKEEMRSGGHRDRLNPYRVAASLLLKRLIWDLQPESWRMRKKLSLLRDEHRGEKAIILCNGPSLNEVDFSNIENKNIFTFGLNKINLLFDEFSFRPSCIVSVNPYVIEQNSAFFSSSDIPLFLDRSAYKLGVKKRDDLYLLDSCDFPFFARDCSMSVFQGYTVTYVGLQLAYHMGFSRVALVGCDHSYPNSGIPNSVVHNEEKDLAHFSEQYFEAGKPWQLPDLAASELYYDVARRCYEEDGRSVINASARSELTVFERESLDVFLND